MPSSQDKSLPASERKLQKARADGQAARSRDLCDLSILGAGGVCMLLIAAQLMEHLQQAMGRQLAFDAAVVMAPGSMLERLPGMLLPSLAASTLFAACTGAAALVGALGSGGWVLSTKPLMPQFSRLDPVAALAHLFSWQQLANAARMVLLTAILGTVAWRFLDSSLETVAPLLLQPSPLAIGQLAAWLASGMGLLWLVLALAALLDIPVQAHFFKARLRMSHEEIKQEHKESDGNPHTRLRIRQRQREIAERASVSAVPRADFVLMNPTHYAVALVYDERSMHAPQLIARGTDLVAFAIRDLAKKHGVPVLHAPRLARALHAHAELDQAIPAALYTAVAQVLAHVYRLKAALRGEGRMPEDLPEPDVPVQLDPLARSAPQAAA
ncbi:EscU/YscU/HrcU family type III secretion system export apparatus switch protein [Verminephrobacter aporrectodeae subsp. tuberculatae]|uniref:EscU/YscU/HrcU family type III secretion system export apparatus switch protein n=1 Tax=Verminephrobacter aporrectodeae TaxID=1110389 RepID=UPI002237278C|nr:EscU/YscU/HrcU family type III secretion system export apparatus switch protein [Verminephrobacter aporrectodeae]MCW5257821.1 EscU/YscU/HrcU family type III secretion system export apparatus switch protein [Verminephrobacter aporrectodeae subsp. tuberculatae]